MIQAPHGAGIGLRIAAALYAARPAWLTTHEVAELVGSDVPKAGRALARLIPPYCHRVQVKADDRAGPERSTAFVWIAPQGSARGRREPVFHLAARCAHGRQASRPVRALRVDCEATGYRVCQRCEGAVDVRSPIQRRPRGARGKFAGRAIDTRPPRHARLWRATARALDVCECWQHRPGKIDDFFRRLGSRPEEKRATP